MTCDQTTLVMCTSSDDEVLFVLARNGALIL